MAGPLRILGGQGALRTGGAVQIELNPRDIERVRKRFEQYRGAPLQKRMQMATLAAANLLRGPISAAAPVGPATDVKQGYLKRSTKARQSSRRYGTDIAFGVAAFVGPTAPEAHLVIRGHRIVTPGGRYLGRSTRANDYVDRAVSPLRPKAVETARKIIFPS